MSAASEPSAEGSENGDVSGAAVSTSLLKLEKEPALEVPEERWRCHDCGVREGETHIGCCDMENCPFCHGQLLSCLCVYEILNIDPDMDRTEEQKEIIDELLYEKGRIPYIRWPSWCARCGKASPDRHAWNESEWDYYIQPDMRDVWLCKPCFERIQWLIDGENN